MALEEIGSIIKFLEGEEFGKRFRKYNDCRRWVSLLSKEKVIRPSILKEIQNKEDWEEANDILLTLLIQDPSLRKLKILSEALKSDETYDNQITLAKMIDQFIATDCKSTSNESMDFLPRDSGRPSSSELEKYDITSNSCCKELQSILTSPHVKDAENVMASLYQSTVSMITKLLEPFCAEIIEEAVDVINYGIHIQDKKAEDIKSAKSTKDAFAKLEISKKWDDTSILRKLLSAVQVVRPDLYKVVIAAFDHYVSHLVLYRKVKIMMKNIESLKSAVTLPGKDEVEARITVSDSIFQLQYDTCDDLWLVILAEGSGIPRDKIKCTSARPGNSSIITFHIPKHYIRHIMEATCKGPVVWAMLELKVIRIEIPGYFQFEVNWRTAILAVRDSLLSNQDLFRNTKTLLRTFQATVDFMPPLPGKKSLPFSKYKKIQCSESSPDVLVFCPGTPFPVKKGSVSTEDMLRQVLENQEVLKQILLSESKKLSSFQQSEMLRIGTLHNKISTVQEGLNALTQDAKPKGDIVFIDATKQPAVNLSEEKRYKGDTELHFKQKRSSLALKFEALLLEKTDSSNRRWLTQLQTSTDPNFAIKQLYMCTLAALKKTFRVSQAVCSDSILNILKSESVTLRWQDCNMLSQMLRLLGEGSDLLHRAHLILYRYQKCLDAFFIQNDILLREAKAFYFPQKSINASLMESALILTCNCSVTLNKLRHIENFLCNEFDINFELLQYLHATKASCKTLLWSISGGEAVKLAKGCLKFKQLSMLVEYGIISIQIDDYFKLSLQGEHMKDFVFNVFKKEKPPKGVFFQIPSKQAKALVNPGVLESYEKHTGSLQRMDSNNPFIEAGVEVVKWYSGGVSGTTSKMLKSTKVDSMPTSPLEFIPPIVSSAPSLATLYTVQDEPALYTKEVTSTMLSLARVTSELVDETVTSPPTTLQPLVTAVQPLTSLELVESPHDLGIHSDSISNPEEASESGPATEEIGFNDVYPKLRPQTQEVDGSHPFDLNIQSDLDNFLCLEADIPGKDLEDPIDIENLGIVCSDCLQKLSLCSLWKKQTICSNEEHMKGAVIKLQEGIFTFVRKEPKLNTDSSLCTCLPNCPEGLMCNSPHSTIENDYWSGKYTKESQPFCIECRWIDLSKLFEKQCLEGNHYPDKIVYYNDLQKDLLTIRIPNPGNTEIMTLHSPVDCSSPDLCPSPHSKEEMELWSFWNNKGILSTKCNPEKLLKYTVDLFTQNDLRMRKEEFDVFALTLSRENYKEKFLKLIDLEEEEHNKRLAINNKKYKFSKWHRKDEQNWFGSLDMPQAAGDFVRQAANEVILTPAGNVRAFSIKGRIQSWGGITGAKGLGCTSVIIKFHRNNKIPFPLNQTLLVKAKFLLKSSYFENLRNSVINLSVVALKKLLPSEEETKMKFSKVHISRDDFPYGLKPDEEYQLPALLKLISSPTSLPFLITGPFGTGKTRLLASAAYYMLKHSKTSRVLIITHHRHTADEYIVKLQENDLFGLPKDAIIRLVAKYKTDNKYRSKQLTEFDEYISSIKIKIKKCRLMITTFLTFLSLTIDVSMKCGYFDYVLIDEGAQTREPENVAAFLLADEKTKFVIAGDHMQVGPKTTVLGDIPRKRGLTVSLLERLMKIYKENRAFDNSKAVLLTNYRSHPGILRLPSSLFYDNTIEAKSKALLHPLLKQPLHFITTSLDEVPFCSWHADKMFTQEAWKELQIVLQLVKYCLNHWPNVEWGKRDPASLGVIFPTRLQQRMWQQTLQSDSLLKKDSNLLMKVTNVPAYDIQGREYKAIFICTSEPVNENFQTVDLTKSLCDPAVFNTVITRSASLIVAVGNPFRLMEIEQKRSEEKQPHICWLTYLQRCWETKSVVLHSTVNKNRNQDKFKKMTFKLEAEIFNSLNLDEKLKKTHFSCINVNEDIILAGYNEALKVKNIKIGLGTSDSGKDRSWSIKETARLQSPKYESKQRPESKESVLCYLKQITPYHCVAFPVEAKKGSASGLNRVFIHEPYNIYGIPNRRGAFDGALVRVAEKFSSRLEYYIESEIENQKDILPMICSADMKNGIWLIPVDGKNPRILNLPHIAEYLLVDNERGSARINSEKIRNYLQKPRKEVVCFDLNSLGNDQFPKVINTLLLDFAKDLLFVVKPLYWTWDENFPVGAVIGILPRGTSLGRARYILNIQYMVPNKEANFDELYVAPAPESFNSSGIAIRSDEGYSSCAFSLTKEGHSYRVQVHITNAAEVVNKSEVFNNLEGFDLWTSFFVSPSKTSNDKKFYPVLPFDIVDKLSFSKNCNRRCITFSASFSEDFTILPDSTGFKFMESNLKCLEVLKMAEVEDILLNPNDHKYEKNIVCMFKKLHSMAKFLKQQRIGDKIYSTPSVAACIHPNSCMILQEFSLLANSEAAKNIALCSPRQVLLKIHRPSNETLLSTIKNAFSNAAALRHFSWLPSTPEHSASKVSGQLVDEHGLQQVLTSLRNQKYRKAKDLLSSFECFPEVGALLSVLHKESFNEEYLTVKLANVKDKSQTSREKILKSLERLYPSHHSLQSTLTSFTNPFDSIFDILIQHYLLKTISDNIKHGALDKSSRLKTFCHFCTYANQQSSEYQKALSLVELAFVVQESSIASTATIQLINSEDDATLEIYFSSRKYHNISVKKIKLFEIGQTVSSELWHSIKITSIKGACRALTDSHKQKGKASINDMSIAVFAPDKDDALHKLEWPITYSPGTLNLSPEVWEQMIDFSTSKSNEQALSLEKELRNVLAARSDYKPRLAISSKCSEGEEEIVLTRYTSKLSQDRHLEEDPKDFQVPLLIIRSKVSLSSPLPVKVWITADPTGYILNPKVQLVELTPHLRLCLQHHLDPEISFTSGVTLLEAKDRWSLLQEYHRFWQDVVLAEAAASSIKHTELAPDSKDNKFLCLTDVLLNFEGFQIPESCLSEEIYEPVGDITTVLPKDFVITKQEFFPFERGTLICARYEIQVSEREEPNVYNKYRKSLETYFDGCARAVFHMIVKNVQKIPRKSLPKVDHDEIDSFEELLPEDPIPYRVKDDLKVSFMILGEHNARISPLMKDLLSGRNKYTCEIQLIPLFLPVKRVYQSLQRMEKDNRKYLNLVNSIALGNLDNLKKLNQEHKRKDDHYLLKTNYSLNNVMWDHQSSYHLSLGDEQRKAFKYALLNRFFVIQGPPGCGKSIIGAHIAYAFALLNGHKKTIIQTSDCDEIDNMEACRCVLYCAPTNDAVDVVAEMLLNFKKELRLLRIYSRGIERRVYPGPSAYRHVFEDVLSGKEPKKDLEKISLHCMIRRHGSKNADKLLKFDEEFKKCERENKVPSGKKRFEYHKLVCDMEAECVRAGAFDIVLCTCNEAAGDRVRRYFKPIQCIIDEASRCTEPETMAPISISQQVILLGDHKQLGPTVHSKKVEDKLKRSLFERYATLLRAEDNQSMFFQLKIQYRMRNSISDFASKWFYEGKLRFNKNIRHVPSALDGKLLKDSKGILFHPIEGVCDGSQRSFSNEDEAKFVAKQIKGMQKYLKEQSHSTRRIKLGILTFYKKQKQLIEKKLKELSLPTDTCQVMTVDSSQGTEFDYVIISTVRSVPSKELQTIKVDLPWRMENIGILDDDHHICVALTRARSGIVVVGNGNILKKNWIWDDLLKTAISGVH